jgi:hypothetical protein
MDWLPWINFLIASAALGLSIRNWWRDRFAPVVNLITFGVDRGGENLPDRVQIVVTNRGHRPGELAGAGIQMTPEGKPTRTWLLLGPQLGQPIPIDAGRSATVEGSWSDFLRSAARERVLGPATVSAVEIHISGERRFQVHRLDADQRAELTGIVSDLIAGRSKPWAPHPGPPIVQEPLLRR